ncbi:acVLRF1 family peptidyl-tRNA hydrolase [Pseudofrankia asymbiotica]|uniref:acVLRF1 family peptidyl-tRNA hydrolase n=1 Tax=Pseudofrankia asymbiotica TaxID=1834516 RepID=UPI0009D77B27|nr:acVLRF1 family peptidyl-tRNA hydrolase [Pseudofrankia asymbiotica]
MNVAPERLAGWFDRFVERHGPIAWTASPLALIATAADGAVADCQVPFPPLRSAPTATETAVAATAATEVVAAPVSVPVAAGDGDPAHQLAAHALVDRRVGVLLVRLGGHAAGVFDGPRLIASKVGTRQVHGRSAAGGWSQHRFARRRDGQVKVALAAAADVAAAVLLPVAAELDAVVLGGERRAAEQVLDDPRLRRLRGLVVPPFLTVPDPRRRVLDESPGQFRAVRIRVVEPEAPAL